MATIILDIMTRGGKKFYRTLRYSFNPLLKINPKAVERYVFQHCPLLKYERDVMIIYDKVLKDKVYGKGNNRRWQDNLRGR